MRLRAASHARSCAWGHRWASRLARPAVLAAAAAQLARRQGLGLDLARRHSGDRAAHAAGGNHLTPPHSFAPAKTPKDGPLFGHTVLRHIQSAAVVNRSDVSQLAFWWTNACHLRGFLQALNLGQSNGVR
jgi:hypothetical protein